MDQSFTSFAYMVAAVLFILALRGLSHPTTSRRGNQLGIIGMVIAILATFAHGGMTLGGGLLIILGIAIGGSIGTVVALRIKMTALPQLVAAFHSLVGLAAVCVAAGALNAPQSFGIGTAHHLHIESLIEMSIGLVLVLLFVISGGSYNLFALIAIAALALGLLLIIPIGGADMPVVVSMLNS